MKERVTVIIGAGANLDYSKELSTWNITQEILSGSLVEDEYNVRPFLSFVYEDLKKSHPSCPESVNFETIYQYINDVYTTVCSKKRVPGYVLPDYPGLTKHFLEIVLEFIVNNIFEKIKVAWSDIIPLEGSELLDVQKAFFSIIRENFNLDVFTLNYD